MGEVLGGDEPEEPGDSIDNDKGSKDDEEIDKSSNDGAEEKGHGVMVGKAVCPMSTVPPSNPMRRLPGFHDFQNPCALRNGRLHGTRVVCTDTGSIRKGKAGPY